MTGDRIKGRHGGCSTSSSKRCSYPEWLKLDTAEVERGKPKGKPREKFTRIEEMLAILG